LIRLIVAAASAIETAQRRGDIRQQRRGDDVAAHQADKTCDEREGDELADQHAVELPGRDAAGAQGAQHRQPLLEGEADRGVDDEETDHEGQQPEGGEVEVEAVGQPFQIGLGLGLHQLQPAACEALQRLPLARCLTDEEPGDLALFAEQPLRVADVDDEHAGRELLLRHQRRQQGVVAQPRRRALLQSEIRQRLRRDQGAMRRRQKRLKLAASDPRRVADLAGNAERLDPEQSDGMSIELHAAFDDRRHRPAGAAQLGEHALRQHLAVACDQHRRARAAEDRCRPVIGIARLLVQRLHTAPQRRRRDQSDQQRRELHRMPAPMTEQHGKNPQCAFHATRPACR
jgi:hypothetical protein